MGVRESIGCESRQTCCVENFYTVTTLSAAKVQDEGAVGVYIAVKGLRWHDARGTAY